jgi:DNA-binding HxlR family transcriptional regulator
LLVVSSAQFFQSFPIGSMGIIGNKWKPIIIYVLQKRRIRFGQLDAIIPLITRKVLTEQLKELEDDGILKGLELLPF